MSQPLPIGGYQWINSNDAQESQLFSNVEAILNLPDDVENGYLFEVDLHYPESIHNTHNDFPFCAEKRTLPEEAVEIITREQNKRLQQEQQIQNERLDVEGGENKKKTKKKVCTKKVNNKIEKLLLTLNDKKKYVLHYRMLKLALKHGLVLKKVHRILKFKLSLWLKSYIDLNTTMRTKCRSDFEKAFFKLMNNAVYGKTMENLRSRVDIKLVNKWIGKRGAGALIANPRFKSCRIFTESLPLLR